MRREYVATLNGKEVAVTVEDREGGRFAVTVDGVERELDAAPVRPGTWSLLLDGRSYVVDLDDRARATALIAENTETPVRLEDARRKRLAEAVGGAAGGGKELVRAPIAGKVVKVFVEVGDEVEAGQGLAVLEAMKMENEIKADRGGRIEALHMGAGDSVETSQALVEIAAE